MTYSDGLYSAYNPVDETGTGLFIRWCALPLNTDETVVHGWFCGEFAFSPIDGKAELSFSISVSEAAAGVSAEFHREGLIAATGESLSDDLNVETGDSRLDRYINIWSEYQIKVCRLWARSSAFQNGGAVGFRDQLQDCASLLLTSPNLLREQILKCSAHQYEAGDVMHWFHEGAPSFCRGVRTMCSDDLLWLVRETAEYVVATGDFALLEVSVPYLKSEPLSVSEHERYEEVIPSDLSESVFDHCTRAIRCFLSRGFDERGIPLILGGDWNDGFSRLGERGRGSSVWLGFFGSECLFKWSEICALTGRKDCSAYYLETAKQISGACFAAWDGDRFIRGWDDNGVPLGTSDSPYFGIDSIAQSFSFFAPCFEAALEEKRVTALNTALKLLRESFGGVWKLFDRPVKARNLGYIGDYPAGVRENGGQYTHGAVWLAIACFRAGKPNEGGAVLRDILSVQETPNYRGEDFVIAADVSSEGRCGWSWYTGSAGWFRRAVVEEMLGIKLRLGAVTVSPSLPDDMDGYRCDIRIGSALCHISVRRTGERAEGYAELSGRSEIYIEATV
ncbi:MAG: hypothetical protein IKZ19_08765 [Clostridia bacterium]|nr:hypothetical protein [Clostridia bacterium]